MDKFFGSKLNSALLIVLIILMVIAIKIMLWNKEIYFHPFNSSQEQMKTENSTPKISGNKDDLVSFSILSGQKVKGLVSYEGVVKGGYFFEANILVNVLDINKKLIKAGHAMATSEWMTAEAVSFEGKLDFSGLSKGPAYIQIQNDNPSDMRENDKFILIPIIID